MRVAIVGGGVAGLSIAILIRRLHICTSVVVYERATFPQSDFGVILPRNGLEALDLVGVGKNVRLAGSVLRGFVIIDSRGHRMGNASFDGGVLGCERQAILGELLRILPSDAVRWGRALQSVVQVGNGVSRLYFYDGSEIEADLVIGADGAGSKVREQCISGFKFKESPVKEVVGRFNDRFLSLRLAGHIEKALAPEGGFAIGAVPTSCEGGVWYAQVQVPRLIDNQTLRKDTMKSIIGLCEGWEGIAAEAIRGEQTQDAKLCHPRITRRLPTLAADNIVLLGDAGHPLLPFTSQGVAAAVEDALVLSDCLACSARLCDAVRMYDELRKPRIEMLMVGGEKLLTEFINRDSPPGSCHFPFAFS